MVPASSSGGTTSKSTNNILSDLSSTSTSAPPSSYSTSSSTNTSAPPPSSSLDTIIDSLKGPKVVSTVAKSSYDWDTYKEKEGLEDELAVASKDG